MGGLVNTSIRFTDGEIFNRIIDTSGIISLFISRAFFNRDKEAIKDLLKELSMESWEEEDFDAVAPYHYGLIVTDFMSDTILDMQSYCTVGHLNLGSYYFEEDHNIVKLEQSKAYQESNLKSVVELFLEKRALEIECRNMNNHVKIYFPIDEKLNNFESVYKYLANINTRNFVKVHYDTRCIIQKIEEEDYTTFMNQLYSINYPLNERDVSLFNDLIKERDGDLEDD